jgi:branched-chain amino acid transport system permease protein
MTGRRGPLALVLVALMLAFVPVLVGELRLPVFYVVLLGSIWFWAGQATSWNILSGFSGYFSFGQGAFVGLGAYTVAVLSGRGGLDLLVSLPVAAVLSTLLGLFVGWLAFRLRSLRGEVFALLTLAVPFILAAIARTNPAIDGGQGVIVPIPPYAEAVGGFQRLVYFLFLGVALASIGAAYVMQRTRFGWALFAVRDGEDVAEGLGVPTFRHKMLAIGLNALLAGLGGAVLAVQLGFVTVEAVFGLTVPLFVIVMSVLGGRNSWIGPTVGAAIVVLLQDRLAAAGFEGWSLVILGLVLATLVVLAPDGLVARFGRRPLTTSLAALVAFGLVGLVGGWGTPLDWVVVGLVAGAVTSFWPERAWPSWLGRRGLSAPARGTAPRGEVGGRTTAPGAASVERGAAPGPGAAPEAQSSTNGIRHAAESAAPARRSRGPLVECRNVTKDYGGVHALRGVSLTIHEGEIVGLIGPNGSGKTTLVGIMAGSHAPTSGDVLVDGASILGLPGHVVTRLGIARTYQIPKPFPSLTVRDNVAVPLLFGTPPLGLVAARREAERILEIVGLDGRAFAYPAEVNLHERQLLEMARALATRPRVLLLDEVLAGLTPAEADVAVGVIRRIHETGVTLVVIEHVLRILNQLAERMVVLDQGLVIADGEPTAVMRHPEVVRAYLGTGAVGVADGAAARPDHGAPSHGVAAVEGSSGAWTRPVDGTHADA